ncbi:MAG: DUF3943 domain-containing protein [bacterium]
MKKHTNGRVFYEQCACDGGAVWCVDPDRNGSLVGEKTRRENIRIFGECYTEMKEIIKTFRTIFRTTLMIMTVTQVMNTATAFSQFKNAKQADSAASHQIIRAPGTDSLLLNPSSRGKYWIAAVEAVGSDLVMWSYFRYIRQDTWARIDIHSIKNNLRTGFWWDEDGFMGNQFNHPYHGSSYYNAARVNGLSFWESAHYTLGGSAIWDLFLETEQPSYTDIVNTPISGIIFGEISFRITDLILDDSKRGVDRILRESSAFILNPMRGFNRLIRGEMWQRGPSTPSPDYKMWLSIGGNNVFRHRTLTKNHGYALLRFDMDYGDLLAASRHNDPFDYFNVHAELSVSKNDRIIGIMASGVLWDKGMALLGTSNVLGVYKEFDLLNNLVYHLTATSVTSSLTNVITLSPATTLQNTLSISGVIMGGVNSQHAEMYGKKYNVGPGASAKVSSLLKISDYGTIYLNYKRYWLHTLNGADSEEFIGLLNLGTNYEITSTTILGFDFLLYERYGDYKHLPNIKEANSAGRLYVKFVLG